MSESSCCCCCCRSCRCRCCRTCWLPPPPPPPPPLLASSDEEEDEDAMSVTKEVVCILMAASPPFLRLCFTPLTSFFLVVLPNFGDQLPCTALYTELSAGAWWWSLLPSSAKVVASPLGRTFNAGKQNERRRGWGVETLAFLTLSILPVCPRHPPSQFRRYLSRRRRRRTRLDVCMQGRPATMEAQKRVRESHCEFAMHVVFLCIAGGGGHYTLLHFQKQGR